MSTHGKLKYFLGERDYFDFTEIEPKYKNSFIAGYLDQAAKISTELDNPKIMICANDIAQGLSP